MAVGAISAASVGRPSDVGRPKSPTVGRPIWFGRPKDLREQHTQPIRKATIGHPTEFGRPMVRTSENQRTSAQIANPLYPRVEYHVRDVGRPKCFGRPKQDGSPIILQPLCMERKPSAR